MRWFEDASTQRREFKRLLNDNSETRLVHRYTKMIISMLAYRLFEGVVKAFLRCDFGVVLVAAILCRFLGVDGAAVSSLMSTY